MRLSCWWPVDCLIGGWARIMIQISIDGTIYDVAAGDRLADAINRAGVPLSQVCYLPILGPIQTCDTCIVEVNGELVRACATETSNGMKVLTTAGRAKAARTEGFTEIADWFETLAKAERSHANRFQKALDQLTD